jgi:hypothetical protein
LTVLIGNKRHGDHGFYVGRPSPLGNPFDMISESDRERVCDQYEEWFLMKCANGDKDVRRELKRLRALHAKRGTITLICWCYPARCHAETIKRWLEANA